MDEVAQLREVLGVKELAVQVVICEERIGPSS
jgi:hypothetical protein